MGSLALGDILRVVDEYIGTTPDHHLSGFTYRSHEEFYAKYCGLTSIDVVQARARLGSTRKTFIGILQEATPAEQAKILRGLLKFLPLESFPEADRANKRKALRSVESMLVDLGGSSVKLVDDLLVESAAVERAISDLETLIQENGASSGVDRVHTALHGYLRTLCRRLGIQVDDRASITATLKTLRRESPLLQVNNPRADDVQKVINSMASIIDALDPIRNQASVAHPNDHLLAQAEALLVVDAVRTVLNYLNRKFVSIVPE